MIDRVRDFWDRRPCNVRHSQRDIDADSLAYSYEVTTRKYRVEPHILRFLEPRRWRNKWVLELGCGIGTDTITLAQWGAKVVAVDISERSVDIARKRAEAHNLDDEIFFIVGDIEQLPDLVAPQHFDLVYSFGVLHHTPNPERVIEHVRQHYMSERSTLKLMLYNRYSWKALWILLTFGRGQFWRMDELIARHSEAQTGCPITKTYTDKTARALLDGFAIDEMSVDHIFPYRIADYVKYHYVKSWYWRLLSPETFRWLETHFGWHRLITARLETKEMQC